MRVEIEDQGVVLDESTSEVAKLRKRRIIYTRTLLLSFSDWETCNELPTDFDSSILRELYDDGSNGALERPRTECSVSLCSSDGSECGPLQSFRGNDGTFQELFSKWDGHSSWLKNKDSNSQRNSNPDYSSQESSSKLAGRSLWLKNKDSHSEDNHDPDSERSCGDRYQFSSQNPDSDGLLQTPDFPRVSACTVAVSAPVVQVHYQLKKCDNPYRPPRMYKAKNDEVKGTLISGKDSTVTTLSNDQQNEKRSVKQSTASDQQDDTESIHDPHINVNIVTMNLSSCEEQSADLNDSSTSSFGAINKSEACVDQENELTVRGVDQVTGGMKMGISDQEYGELTLNELSFCATEVESGASAILSKNHIVETDNTLGPTLHRNELTPSLVEEENAASGKSSGRRKGIVKVNGGYNGIVTGNSSTEVSAGRNGPIDKPMASMLPNTTYENSEQTYSSLTPTEAQAISIFAVEQSILSDGRGSSSTVNHPAKEHVSEMEYEKLNFANSAAFSEQNMGFSLRPHCKEIESRNISIQRNTRDTETPEVTIGMDFLKELSSDEPAFSIQIGSFHPNIRQDNSNPCGTKFQDVDDDFLISILDNSGAFEMCGEDTRAITFFAGTEMDEIEDDQSDYEEVWEKILSILRTEQESESSPLALSDKTVDSDDKVCSLDEDSLVAIDSTIVYEGSKFVSSAAPVLPTEEEQNLPPPKPDKIADFNLPDEDSLITIEDLIAPLSLESLKIENMVKTDKFTSEVVPNEKATIRHLSPTDHVHLQKSRLQSQESKKKTGQTQLSSQINFQEPKTDQGHTPPPVCCSCNDEHTLSWKSLAAKPNIFENTICYSVLEQPRNLRQQSQLHKSVTFPDPVKLLGCSKHELCTYFYPLNYLQRSYQGSGVPNPDFCRFGGNNDQAIVNGFGGTNLEARSMHPYIAGYGQDLSNQSMPGFQHS